MYCGEFVELSILVDSFLDRTGHAVGRTVYRDGQSVRVVYISITETPISFIQVRIFNRRETPIVFSPTTAFNNIELPQMVEIYYLRNLHRIQRRIHRMSDEDFDALRKEDMQIWSGVIRVAD